MFQQIFVPVPAFADNLIPLVEGGGAVSQGDECLLRQAELAPLGLLVVWRGKSLDAPFRSEGDAVLLQLPDVTICIGRRTVIF